MNTKALNSLAALICRAQEQDRTPMGVAFAIDSAGQHMSPETAAELERFRALELGDTDGRVSAACGDPGHPTWLRAKDDTRRCPWCRVAELEAERHSTNEALSDAAEALRRQRDRIIALETAPTRVFRASHDSIVMGLYTTREAAQAHCEAKVQQEEPAGSIRHMSWVADDIGPDAEYELHITPAETGGLIRGTGYVVTPLEVASEYDEEADE